MKIEHLAFNVPDPLNMARWYTQHLGLVVKRRTIEPPYAHFLADDSGTVMLEIYGNTQAPSLNFPEVQPPALHLAFLSRDLAGDVRRLTAAGATIVADVHSMPTGDQFAMLRDPWGIPIQLVRRKEPMIE
ncbi:MAG: VOC family protein [Planctomycetaceae bacterium]|nr:VOC family protein [Planctomycetaceae bacterium]